MSRWQRFLFDPAPAEGLGRARALFYGGLFVLYGPGVDLSAWGAVSPELWRPVFPYPASVGPPPEALLRILEVAFELCLVAAALGVLFPIVGPGAFLLGWALLALPNQFGRAYHVDAPVVLLLGVLAFSRAADAFTLRSVGSRLAPWAVGPFRKGRRESGSRLSGEYRWPVQAARVALCLVFFAAGVSKLRNAGWAWLDGQAQGFLLLDRWVTSAPWTDWGPALAARPGWLAVGAALVLAVELSYPAALFRERLRPWLVAATLGVLLGFKVLLGPEFVALAFCHLWWWPWERVGDGGGGSR